MCLKALPSTLEYAAFLTDDGTFCLICSLPDEGQGTRIGEDGYLRLGKDGILLELELLFARAARVQDYDIPEGGSRTVGIPGLGGPFDVNPVLVIVESTHRTFIVLSQPPFREVDRVLTCPGLSFLVAGQELVALELLNLVQDPDGSRQLKWLVERGLV